jgi:hypothetical protein
MSLEDDKGIGSEDKPHMHALVLTFEGKDKITQKWTSFEGGKEKDSTVMSLTRAN